ncbi:cytochrome-c peroxidase [Winogradskyella costae]|uniref:cytochrome-c peroxidase n=1 Tax=Winogradskyella costae TaxID=2697008 RepID=UPI0015C95E5C|nr:cytochrome c peroxidase [Winogradskyella costae]
MKKIIFLIISVLICSLALSGKDGTEPFETNAITENIEVLYASNFYKFQAEVNSLVKLTSNSNSSSELKAIKTQVEKTRLVYKKIEFIFDYYQTFYNGTYINGAPLPKVSEYYEEGKIIEPSGLQALDEAVNEEASIENIEYIKKLATELKAHVDYASEIHLPIRIKSSQVIECMRSGMVRIFTLGVTGFDTPGSVNALKESYVSLQSMETAFLYFEEDIQPKAKSKFRSIKKHFKKGKKILSDNVSFNDFDRMTFLKEVINPLYAELLAFQNLNKITLEPYKKHAQNYKAVNLFQSDFLDTKFYSELVYLPLDNPKTIQLGALLFKDTKLSNGNIMSCVSCHDPNKGFTDGLPKSLANKKGFYTSRNSPTVINSGYASRYFWDLRSYDLERQVGHVIDNDLEFNTTFKAIVKKLKTNPNYLKLFKDAYGGIDKQDINERSISNAIAAYVNSLKSFDSPFDKYVRNESNDYPKDALRGFNLFMGKAACGTCHFAPMFNGTVPPFYLETESEVLGVTQGFDTINPKLDTDMGRYANGLDIDKQPYFRNSFKTVSVRNIALTAPYMHNGSFNTLEEVLEFYNLGGGAGMGLEVENQTLSDAPLDLTTQEIKDIIAFMESLTDTSSFKTDLDY